MTKSLQLQTDVEDNHNTTTNNIILAGATSSSVIPAGAPGPSRAQQEQHEGPKAARPCLQSINQGHRASLFAP